jgi:hypothetical protein
MLDVSWPGKYSQICRLYGSFFELTNMISSLMTFQGFLLVACIVGMQTVPNMPGMGLPQGVQVIQQPQFIPQHYLPQQQQQPQHIMLQQGTYSPHTS